MGGCIERLAYTALQNEANMCLQQCTIRTRPPPSTTVTRTTTVLTVKLSILLESRTRVDRFAVSDTYVLSASGKEGDRSPRS